MNRIIKFRGKMIPENEWIFGTILRIPAPPVCVGKSETDKYYIQFPDQDICQTGICHIEWYKEK